MPYRRQFYIPALDGLRALAVAAVFFYHVDERRFPGGFLGVDLFFVISGYVITLGLLDEWRARGSIDLPHFWRRRVRRLVPASVVLILAAVAATALWAPDRMASLRGEAGAAMAYVANWYLVFHRMPYFETMSAPSLLRHLWSLAVEEQFYLIWPPVLALGLRVASPRKVLAATVALAAASAVLLAVLYARDAATDRLYYGTDTRGFALLAGAALAFVCKPRASRLRLGRFDVASGLLGAGSLGLLGVLCWNLNGAYPFVYQGGLALAALAGVGAVAMCARADNAYTRVLESRPMRWLGTRSYSAYLWHWPVVMLLPVHPGPSATALEWFGFALLAAAVTLTLAEASFRWVEQPIRDGGVRRFFTAWRELPAARQGVVLAGATACAVALMSLTVTAARARVPEPPSYLAVPRLNTVLTAADVGPAPEAARVPAPTSTPIAAADTEAIATAIGTVAATSTAAPASAPVPGSLAMPIVATAPPGTPEPLPLAAARAPEAAPPPAAVPLSATPPLPDGQMVTAIGDSVMLGGAAALARALGVVDLDAEAGRSASAALETLRERAATGRVGAAVVLHIGDNGVLRADRLDDMMRMLSGVRRVVVVNLRVPRAWEGPNNALLADLVRRYPNATLVDWHAASEGHPEYLYSDQIHLTPEGAAVYANLIADAIR